MSNISIAQPTIANKRCTKCGVEQPATEFHKCKNTKDGLTSNCKKCKARYAEANREKTAAYHKAWWAANKVDWNEKRKAWSRANKERESISRKIFYESNKEQILAYQKAYYESNKERINKRNNKWLAKNRDIANACSHRYRARKRSAPGSFTQTDIQKLLSAQKEKCAYCKKKVSGRYHVDHIYPLARGGSNSPDNLQILCQTCNQRKHTTDPIEYAQKMGLLL